VKFGTDPLSYAKFHVYRSILRDFRVKNHQKLRNFQTLSPKGTTPLLTFGEIYTIYVGVPSVYAFKYTAFRFINKGFIGRQPCWGKFLEPSRAESTGRI